MVVGVDKVLEFRDFNLKYWRVFLKNGNFFSGDANQFQVVPLSKSTLILNYFKEIAHHVEIKDDNEESFLGVMYDRINFINCESVLASYLTASSVQLRHSLRDTNIFPFKFNLSQKKALENALSRSISIIEGPPGTGKTQTILNIISNLIAVQRKTVGVVSFNNEAVNNVRDKLKDNGYGFLVADLGRKEKRKAFFGNLPSPDFSSWNNNADLEELYDEIIRVNKELDSLLLDNNHLAGLKQELFTYQLEQQHFEEYYRAQSFEKIERLPFYTSASEKIIQFIADIVISDKLETNDKFLFRIKLLFKYGIFNFGKLKENEIQKIILLQRKFYSLKIEEIKNACERLSIKLEKKSFKELLDKHESLSSRLFRKYIYESHKELKKADFDEVLYRINDEHFKEFLKFYPVILSTNHSLLNSIPDNYLLDYVIIDEASQVDLLTGVLVLSRCRNVIIVGDSKQLPQIVDEKIKERIQSDNVPDEYDYFKHSILSSILSVYKNKIPKEILKEHYRCHPQIIEFCNQKFYNGELIPFTSPDLCDNPLILFKTTPGNHMRKVTCGDEKEKGKYNQRELDIIKEEVCKYLDVNLSDQSIGFVTPYRKQVQKAKSYLSDKIESDTVHKYQGREKEIMILSTVLDNSVQGKQGLRFVDDPHILNVAVSRAIKQLVVVTDNELFERQGRHIRDLLQYIQYNTLEKNIIESNIVSVFDLLYRNFSQKLNSLNKKLLNHSKFKSENIMFALLEEILSEPQYSDFSFTIQVMMRNIIRNLEGLDTEEINYINNRACVDFIIFRKMGKENLFAIEVDGFQFHENNPEQLKKDYLKDSIFKKCKIPLLRLPTNGSGEDKKIRQYLDSI